MFQFPRFPSPPQAGMTRLFIAPGCPIRRSPVKLARQLTEAFRSLATSFIGLQCLGIHHAPLVALTTTPLPSQRGLGSLRSLSIRLLRCFRLFRRAARPFQGRTGGSGEEPAHEKAGLVADPAEHQSCFISRLLSCQGRFRQVHPFRGSMYLVEPEGLEPPTCRLRRPLPQATASGTRGPGHS